MNTFNDTLNPLARRALVAIYALSSQGRTVDERTLAASLGISSEQAWEVLRTLDAAGLVWAARGRLTLLGLAVAVPLACRAGRAAARAA